jgi:hypothetical protein
MKYQKPLPFARHVELFMVWVKLVIQSFPPLWAAAEGFAPLVMARCPVCQKPRYVLWIPVGDHALCSRLDTVPDLEPDPAAAATEPTDE